MTKFNEQSLRYNRAALAIAHGGCVKTWFYKRKYLRTDFYDHGGRYIPNLGARTFEDLLERAVIKFARYERAPRMPEVKVYEKV